VATGSGGTDGEVDAFDAGSARILKFRILIWSAAMIQKETLGETQMSSAIPQMHSEILNLARKRMDTFLTVQKEFMQTLEDINHDIFNRAKAEAELASEFVGRLSAVRSVPDATTTYQEWASRELELLAEDGRHLFANGEKIMEVGRRLFASQ
jgi:hypothetical protein